MSLETISSMGSSSQLSAITDFLTGSSLGQMIPSDKISTVINQLSQTGQIALLSISLIIALLGCFLGYRFAKAFMGFTGFVLGIFIGYYIFSTQMNLSGITLYLATLASGVFIAGMSFWIYRGLLFLLCFVFAFAAAATFMPFTNDVQFFLCTLVGFIVGAISQRFLRGVLIFLSASVCGMWAGANALQLAGLLHSGIPTDEFFQLIVGVVFAVLGVFVQFLTTKPAVKPAKHSRKEKKENE